METELRMQVQFDILGHNNNDDYWAYVETSNSGVANNFEFIEFDAPYTGTYRIAIQNIRCDEDDNNGKPCVDEQSNRYGIALLNIKNYVYVPIIIKN